MKSVILNVRIPQKLRDNLIEDSYQKEISLSDATREILSSYYEDLNKDEIDNQTFHDMSFHNSSEFTYLSYWMVERIRDPKHYGTKNELLDIKKIVLEVITNKFFPTDLKQEFEKVLIDIQRYINDFDFPNNRFKFCEICTNEVFDYHILSDFIRHKAFENII